MLKHLPRSGMDFLHIFNLSWTSHSFPSIWKTSSIIPIHKIGKPLDCSASIRSIYLTSCVSKLFERIILSRLLVFLESNSILSPRQAGFRLRRSAVDQILYLSESTSNGFNKPRPGSRTILSTTDCSKAFDSVWHPAFFHKLISAGLPPCFARWTQPPAQSPLTRPPPPFQSNSNFSSDHLRPHSFFFKHVSSLKAKFFPRLKAFLQCLCFLMVPL